MPTGPEKVRDFAQKDSGAMFHRLARRAFTQPRSLVRITRRTLPHQYLLSIL
ncbi:hypothetical protein DCCM_3476 [Desulfocucumis palustris]|uniref:Uncharacterized protein n=1 Tax=Desulfocucumis palustris TaxID=1898651 RepID=A0A2L2XED2_9FIRM|nr:hypothetical protein DCCM_3476 [Desulfocucumis palustris]